MNDIKCKGVGKERCNTCDDRIDSSIALSFDSLNIFYYDPSTKEIIIDENILPHEKDYDRVAHLIYIGDEKTYASLTEKGISEFFVKDGTRVACVGRNPETQEWFGWSHRGYGKFYIGFEVKEGSMLSQVIAAGYSPKTEEHCKTLAFLFADLLD